jgi:hypothetical protein
MGVLAVLVAVEPLADGGYDGLSPGLDAQPLAGGFEAAEVAGVQPGMDGGLVADSVPVGLAVSHH